MTMLLMSVTIVAMMVMPLVLLMMKPGKISRADNCGEQCNTMPGNVVGDGGDDDDGARRCVSALFRRAIMKSPRRCPTSQACSLYL